MRSIIPLPVLAAAASSILGGSAVVVTRMLVGVSDATSVAFLRSAGVAIVLAAFVFGVRAVRFAPREIVRISALGVMMFGAYGWLFSAGLAYVPAARGAVVLATMPILTLVIAALFGRERLTWPKALGAAFALAGVVVALGDKAVAGPEAWRGDLCMALAALLGASHAVLSSMALRRHAAVPVLAVQVVAGTVALGIALVARGDAGGLVSFSGFEWLGVFWLLFVAGLPSYVLWFWALERAPASAVSLTVSLNPISAAILGALFLFEPVTARLAGGLACVIVGIVLANSGRAAPDRSA
jgi:drug/metabolite transporter (DMT)-like permease